MQLKEYPRRALETIRGYLELLAAWRKKALDNPARGIDSIRKVFDICTQQAKSRNWSELGLEMKDKVLRFEVLAEDEWEAKLNEVLAE